jgi:CubicO group peptidase (beta-lactamase class C family)
MDFYLFRGRIPNLVPAKNVIGSCAATIFCILCGVSVASRAADKNQDRLRNIVDSATRAVMVKDNITGMAVGITIAGNTRVFNYGLASRKPRKPVTDDTLFELGSTYRRCKTARSKREL